MCINNINTGLGFTSALLTMHNSDDDGLNVTQLIVDLICMKFQSNSSLLPFYQMAAELFISVGFRVVLR